jgi:predicted glycosyltransferase
MKIIYYCQNIWGIGHLFRSLEIIKALSRHEVVLVTGGQLIDIPLLPHVREIHLPGISMDRDNKKLLPTEAGLSYVEAKKRRRAQFFDVFAKEAPDLFIIELYPFGRNAFRFELAPVFKAIRNKDLLPCKVICSLRDILVEKRDQIEFEERVIKRLNRWFDAVLIHSDPNLIKLNDFFSRISDIKPLIHYTGFVSAELPPNSREEFRKKLNIPEDATLLVASAGGGRSGALLLKSVVSAFRSIQTDQSSFLFAFTGPYIDQKDFDQIKAHSGNGIFVSRFTDDFLSYLIAADLSVSMGGYNTCMNIIATKVPAMVLPFSGDREQGIRVSRLERLGILKQLNEPDLVPERLSALMKESISRKPLESVSIDMNGALNSTRWIEEHVYQ